MSRLRFFPSPLGILFTLSMVVCLTSAIADQAAVNFPDRWTTFTSDDGLVRDEIKSLFEDREGQLWVGTNGSGVSRFDGHNWTSFTSEHGLADNDVEVILQDREGFIWFGTKGGASRFDGRHWETFTSADGLVDNEIECGFLDVDGSIWFGTKKGASRFDGSDWSRSPGRHLAGMEVDVILRGTNNDLWFGTGSNGIHRFDDGKWTNYTASDELTSNQIIDALLDQSGDLWFATDGGGLNRFDGFKWSSHTAADGLPGNAVEAVMLDRSGNIWIGTDGAGAGVFDGEEWTSFDMTDGLASNIVEDLLEDRHGYIWFGTDGAGLSRFEDKDWFSYTTANGLGFNKVKDLLQDDDGTMWFATDGGGVSRLGRDGWATLTTADGLTHNEVEILMRDSRGHLWFGTEGGGASRFDGETWTTYSEEQGLSHDEVEWIIEDREGNMYFATDGGGISRFDGHEFTNFTTSDGLANNEVKAMIQDRHGLFWIATENGVSRFDGEKFLENFTVDDGLLRHRIEIIFEDEAGGIWCGSQGGLMKFDGERWTTFTTADGLVSNEVRGIYQDREGHLWFGTTLGASRFDGDTWTSYTTADGLVNSGVRKTYQDRDGRFWFATLNGVSRFTPRPSSSPPISVDAVIVDRRYEGVTDLEIADDQGLVTFEFSSKSATPAARTIGYRYRLVGLDEDWRGTPSGRAEYTDLPRGTYTFEVIAVDRDLVQSVAATAGLVVSFNYLSIAAWSLLVAGLIALLVQTIRVFHRERSMRTLNDELERSHVDLEHLVEERTAELMSVNERLESEMSNRKRMEDGMRQTQKMDAIGQLAAGVAHNFNNMLQAITGNLEMAEEITDELPVGPGTVSSYLSEARTSAERAADVVRQLMLVSRSDEDSADHVAVDLRQVVVNTIALCRRTFDRKIDLQHHWSEVMPSVNGDEGQLEQVLLNLCLNSRDAFGGVEHDEWRVVVGLETRTLALDQLPGYPDIEPGIYGCLRVEDNGMGMDEETRGRIFEPFFTTKEIGRGTGLGLSNAYGVVREHGGWIECESDVGVGTAFSVFLPAVAHEGELSPSTAIHPSAGGEEKIMVVDDETAIRTVVAQRLVELGYDVSEAEDGFQCLAQLRQKTVDLVLLDISMPGMSGIDVLATLRSDYPEVLVILFTGYAAKLQDDAGADDVVQKPVNMQELASRVRAVLDGS